MKKKHSDLLLRLEKNWQCALANFENCTELRVRNPHGPFAPKETVITDQALIKSIADAFEKQKYELKAIPGVASTSDWTEIKLYNGPDYLETFILWGGESTIIYPIGWEDDNYKLVYNLKLIQEIRQISGIGDPFEGFYDKKDWAN